MRALHPDGFLPEGLVEMDNGSLALGIKGEAFGRVNWDFSSQYGVSEVDSSTTNSNNVSYGTSSPTTAFVRILDGPSAGSLAPVGFQPSPGLTPQDATKQSRHSWAAYGELEKDLSSRLTMSAAARFEDYSDFGNSTTFKVGGRFEVAEPLAIRASYNTGFRAPHLAQSFFCVRRSPATSRQEPSMTPGRSRCPWMPMRSR